MFKHQSSESNLVRCIPFYGIITDIIFLAYFYNLFSISISILTPYSIYFRLLLFCLLIGKPINTGFDITFITTESSDKTLTEKKEDTSSKSKLFGILERMVIGFLLLLKAYETIGLILAAKAIVRENRIKKDDVFAEFYYIGTLYSLIGVIVFWAICYW